MDNLAGRGELHFHLPVDVEVVDHLGRSDSKFGDLPPGVVVDVNPLRQDQLDVAVEMMDDRELKRRWEALL